MGESQESSPLKIEHVTVAAEKITALVSYASAQACVPRAVAACLCELLPDLASQTCVSGGHTRRTTSDERLFAGKIVGTNPAHLLEHVAIELLVCESALCEYEEPPTFTGYTRRASSNSVPCTAPTSCAASAPAPCDAAPASCVAAAPAPCDAALRTFMNVNLTFDDDLVTLGALKAAAQLLEWAYAASATTAAVTPSPNVAGISRDLHVLRTC